MAARRSATIFAALVSALLLALAGAPALAAHHEEGEHGEEMGEKMKKEGMEEQAEAKSALAKQVSEALGAEEGLSGVHAKAMGKTVKLKGTVANASLRDRAEAIASGVEGVESVKNEIEVDVAAGGSDTGSGGY